MAADVKPGEWGSPASRDDSLAGSERPICCITVWVVLLLLLFHGKFIWFGFLEDISEKYQSGLN